MPQLTLTGVQRLNQSNYFNGSGDYYAVVNALWRKQRVGASRQTFLKSAQQDWKNNYKGHPDKIRTLLTESMNPANARQSASFVKTAERFSTPTLTAENPDILVPTMTTISCTV
jgi:hypothetical protein